MILLSAVFIILPLALVVAESNKLENARGSHQKSFGPIPDLGLPAHTIGVLLASLAALATVVVLCVASSWIVNHVR